VVVVERLDGVEHLQGGPDGPQRVVLVCLGGAEDGHDGVAEVLVDVTAVGLDDPAEFGEQVADDPLDGLRVATLGERGEPGEVGEQDGEGSPFFLCDFGRERAELAATLATETHLQLGRPLRPAVRTGHALTVHRSGVYCRFH